MLQNQNHNNRKQKMTNQCFDQRTVKVNFVLGIDEINLILEGLKSQNPAVAKPLFEMMRNAALEEIKAAKETHDLSMKELENGNT